MRLQVRILSVILGFLLIVFTGCATSSSSSGTIKKIKGKSITIKTSGDKEKTVKVKSTRGLSVGDTVTIINGKAIREGGSDQGD